MDSKSYMNMHVTSTSKLETLQSELQKARQEAEQQKAAATKAEKDLAAEKVARDKDQARVLGLEETLKGVFEVRDKLRAEVKQEKEELEKL